MELRKPANHSESLSFRDLVQYLLQPLQDYSRRKGIKGRAGALPPTDLKRAAISKFVARWRTEVGDDVFPFFRLLMPERDKDRLMYKIKEANLAKLFIKILGISPASEDAISIEKWKIPGAKGAAGDFPGRLYEVLKSRAAISGWGNMSIDEVNEHLDQLSRCSKESQQRPILTHLYNRMSAEELRWLASIILRTLKIGATERTIFDIWHPDAHKLFNKSSSLSRVCWELYDPSYRLPDAEKDISVFSCFQPQLAAFKKNNIADVVKKMGGKTFYIEEKLDGERIQLHKSGSEYKYWSRKAKDYTYLYGMSYGTEANQEGGGLTKYLRNAFHPGVKTIVLDGEMITWNDKFDAPVGFGSLKSAANAEKNNSNSSFEGHPFYCVFDVLSLNGKSLTHYSLRERRKVLEGTIVPVTRRIEIVPVQEADKETEVEARLRECVANATEGLVVKDPDSAYRTNDRNESWIKVKPEYMEEYGENLDLLIIGGYWGEGRRGNRLSAFLCGVREESPSGSDPVPKFLTFARVGGGFNGPDYARIDHITDGHWHKFDAKNRPSQYYTYATNRNGTVLEAPDMWIAPEHSVVIQLKAASAASSDQFATRVTLRFPRFECIRDDKDWQTATSMRDFINLQAQAATERDQKALKVHIRRKQNTSRSKAIMSIQGAEVSHNVPKDQISTLFMGLHFYVLTESKSLKLSKSELESLIRSHGGTIDYSEGDAQDDTGTLSSTKRKRDATEPCTRYIVAERKVVKVAALMSRGLHDVILPAWISRSIEHNLVLDMEPHFMFFTTTATEAALRDGVDEYGDSFTNPVTEASLRKLLLTDMSHVPSSESDDDGPIAELRRELMEMGEVPLWTFARFVAYFHDDLKQDDHAVRLWRMYGGKRVTDVHDLSITHVILDAAVAALDRDGTRRIRSLLSLRDKVPRVVSIDWIEGSIEAGTALSEERYMVMS